MTESSSPVFFNSPLFWPVPSYPEHLWDSINSGVDLFAIGVTFALKTQLAPYITLEHSRTWQVEG